MSAGIVISQLFNGLSPEFHSADGRHWIEHHLWDHGSNNFAHGEFLMMGAYTTYVVHKAVPGVSGVAFLMALPLAFAVTALIGLLLERSFIRYLYGRPYEGMLATWGLSLILQQTARSVFGANNVDVSTPVWLRGGVELMQGTQLPTAGSSFWLWPS